MVSGRSIRPRNTTADRRKIPSWIGSEKRNFLSGGKDWRAPSERIRTAFEIPIEVDLVDEGAVPIYMKISEKVLHLRRLGVGYASICERLGVNRWMALRAVRWGKTHRTKAEALSD